MQSDGNHALGTDRVVNGGLMARVTRDIGPAQVAATFPNGTVVETRVGAGSATQFTPEARGLRSTQLPSEVDTSPEFEAALRALGIIEQETVHVDVLPPAGRLRGAAADDRIILRPFIPPGDTDPRVVLYQDESGGLSWHFAEGALLTDEERERAARRGLRAPGPTGGQFVIPARTVEARETMGSGIPRGSLRGPITKIGRKILKVLVIPVTDALLAKPIEMIVRSVEQKVRQNLIWSVTPDNYNRRPDVAFADWARLDRRRTLLIVHGILSSVEGMLTALPRSAMERWCYSYEGRVIAFNHLSVTESPEDNARFFLERAKQAGGQFEFDIVCHSRGGIVSRMMAERGEQLVPGSNAAFKSIYFVASPNNGSQLGDPDHMVDMVDVFTNFLTNFPDGPVMYSIEALLAVVKLLASAGMKRLAGIAAMGTAGDGFIATQLNAGGRVSVFGMPRRLPITSRGPAPITGFSAGGSAAPQCAASSRRTASRSPTISSFRVTACLAKTGIRCFRSAIRSFISRRMRSGIRDSSRILELSSISTRISESAARRWQRSGEGARTRRRAPVCAGVRSSALLKPFPSSRLRSSAIRRSSSVNG